MAWIAYASLLVLALGLFTSTALCSLSLALMYPPGIYFTWHAFKNLRWHALPTPAWALIAFTIIGIISCTMNMETIDDPLKAALKVKYFLIGALSIAVFRHIIKSFITSKLIKGLVLSLVISIGTTTLYGLYVLCTHDNFLNLNEPGASGRNWGFTDYMRHAHSCLYITILMIAWLVHGTTIKISIKTMCIVAIVFGVIGIITSGTRGAIGAFLISFPLIWGHRKWMWKIAGGAIIASAAFFAFNLNYTTDKGVFRPVAPDRANMWYLAIKAFEEKPILGHGVRQFEVQASRLEATHGHWLKQPTGKIRGIAHAHNIGMQLLADVGLAGTVTWGLWYILSISCFFRTLTLRWSALAFFTAFGAAGMLQYVYDTQGAMVINYSFGALAALQGLIDE